MLTTDKIRQLERRMRNYHHVEHIPGLLKIIVWGVPAFGFAGFAFLSTDWNFVVFYTLISALAYVPLMVATHDALHHTLTGWRSFDEAFARVVSYPVGWVFGIYSSLHKVHHKLNGVCVDDPERINASHAEWERAEGWQMFYLRHQWLISIFIFAGIGGISHHLYLALQRCERYRGLKKMIVTDLVGITVTQIALLALSYVVCGNAKWVLMYFIYERVLGAILQFRRLIEHYGLSAPESRFHEAQIIASRNIRTSEFVSRYFNRLNYHSLHHAFPKIPFYHLPKAHAEMIEILTQDERALVTISDGYFRTAWQLHKTPRAVSLKKSLI